MLYLHSNDVIHRDLKPKNILMDYYLFPKIADFGLAKAVGPTMYAVTSLTILSDNLLKGNPQYMSPESLSNLVYTKPNDVFAFSILVYEILTLRQPYSISNYYELLKNVVLDEKRPELTQDIPQPFQKLLSKCWNKDPNERPTFEEIVNDLKDNQDYIQDYINEDEYYKYIDFIDNTKNSFDLQKSIRFKDLADGFKKANIHEEESENSD